MEFDIAMPALDPLESGDQWPFSWSTVNVPGSPGLSRLFAALELEESSPVPELSLSDTEVDTSQIVSVTELSDLFNEKNKGLVYDIDGAGCFQGHDATYNYRKFKRGQIPWRDLDQAFMGWSESALTKEVYVFPAPVTRNIPSLLSLRHGTMASLECKEAYLTDRLHKLEASILPNHGGVIATKEALAEVYESQYRLEEALDTYHEVYQQKRRIWGSSHFNSLSTRVSICRLLLCQCDLKIGLETVEDTISELDSIFGPEHELAVSAAVLKARFLTSLGKHNEAEKLDRQCLQIRLNNYGPKDEQTLESMKFLGISLAKQTHASGPQRLLQTTVQLYYEVPGTPEVFICDATMRLLWALGDLQLYEECHQLRHAALMRFEASLGSQHSLVLNIRLGLAWDLYEEGKFEESEREFRYMLALGFQSRNQRRIDTLLALNGLAHALGRLGHFEEAISCYEKTFQGFTGIFGPEDARSCYACDSLGRYYEQQNRAKDAVELYRKMIKMLQEGGFSDHTAIADCTRGIERLTSAADSEFLLLRA
jgi:tetratricopeptide (TPR) repeat protein